jgi:hypothetical protein
MPVPLEWMPLMGHWDFSDHKGIVFRGRSVEYPSTRTDSEGEGVEPAAPVIMPGYGVAITNQTISEGRIEATVFFDDVEGATAEIIVAYDVETKGFIAAGLGGHNLGMFVIREWIPIPPKGTGGTEVQPRWVNHEITGDRANLKANTRYRLRASMTGSRVTLHVNDVHVASAQLSSVLAPGRQTGLWCRCSKNITIRDYSVSSEAPKAFVVMQFSEPFDDVYLNVIKAVCKEFGVEAIRADEMYGPGVIVKDITDQVLQSQLVIADISPRENANVYFEVGYALALNKPIILLARKGTQLPFDVSGFRVLFYEDSIGGKVRVEEGLRNHLRAIRGDAPSVPDEHLAQRV